MALNDEDIRVLKYFYEEYGDFTQCGTWDEKEAEIRERFPALILAWELKQHAETYLKQAMENLSL